MTDITSSSTDTVVRHSITVEAPVERAFDVYASQAFTNPDHHLLDADMEAAVLEPFEGGRWYERAVDGRECDWGRVLVWDRPHRIVLTWQVRPDFTPEIDPERASEVELRFVADGPDRTRVDLEHRALERHGEDWKSMRDAVDGADGWPDDLARLAAGATAG